MLHITVALPDDVAQEYYNASQKLADYLGGEPRPSAQTLMRLILAGFTADDVTEQFDRALLNLTGAPVPDESDTYVFAPEFENIP
jgi:hypothetical protein